MTLPTSPYRHVATVPWDVKWILLVAKFPSGQEPPKTYNLATSQETAKHRVKFGWRPVSDVAAVKKTRRETRWNLLGCPKLPNRSQPLVGRGSPYCEDTWGTYCCLTSFLQIVDTCINSEDTALQICATVRRLQFCALFLRPVYPASRVQHISDLHSKFALRPHHV